MAFVYLLCDSGFDNRFKIGVTKQSIEKRVKQLQTGNGSEIFLSSYYETEHPFYIEKMLHKEFCFDKQVGEWFELDNEKALSFSERCKFYENNLNVLKDNPFLKKI